MPCRARPQTWLNDKLREARGTDCSEVDNAVKRRKAIHADELLAESELGQQVLTLRQEKDELLDVVWLATSGTEIRQLWQKVVELLGDEQTQLQKDALAIEPAADD